MMKRILIAAVCIILCLSGCHKKTEDLQPQETESTPVQSSTEAEETPAPNEETIENDEAPVTSSGEGTEDIPLTVPSELSGMVQSASWMTGVMVSLPDCTRTGTDTLETYHADSGTITAEIDVANGTEGFQACTLLILADGAPAEFTIDGETQLSYHMDLEGYRRLTAEIDAQFDLHIGRLDFYVMNESGPEHVSYSVMIEQEEDPVLPEDLHETVSSREGVAGHFLGNCVASWLWDSEDQIYDDMNRGPDRISYRPGDSLIFEETAGEDGYYRTVLICGGQIADASENGEPIRYIDWQGSGENENMLQFSFRLNELPGETAVFRQITTLLSREKAGPGTYDCFFSTKLIRAE